MEYNWLASLKQMLYPFTLKHLIYFIIITGITTYITEYFLKFKLLKWIYVGTVSVIIATLYNKGDDKDVALDVFKLATL